MFRNEELRLEFKSPDQGPTASKEQRRDSSSAALTPGWCSYSSLQPSGGPGGTGPSSPVRGPGGGCPGLTGLTGAEQGALEAASFAVRYLLFHDAPHPSPLRPLPPPPIGLSSLSPPPTPGLRPRSRGDFSVRAPFPGAGRSHSPAWGPSHLSVRLGWGRPGRRTRRGSPRGAPAQVRGGGRRRLWPAGREERRAGGRKEVGLGPRRGRKFSQGSRSPRASRGGGKRGRPEEDAAQRLPASWAAGSRLHPSDLSFPRGQGGSRGSVRRTAPRRCGPRPRPPPPPAGQAARGRPPGPAAPDTARAGVPPGSGPRRRRLPRPAP